MNIYEILQRPLITEKSALLGESSKYTFEVRNEANKHQIQEAVEKIFKVNVVSVNIVHVPGKSRRVGRQKVLTRAWKKAIVTLQPGEKIELFEGV